MIKKGQLKEFWKTKNETLKKFNEEYDKYSDEATGWFKENEEELFVFLKRRAVKLETSISKTEIEKIIKRHVPHVSIKKWDGNNLIVDIDVLKLKRQVVRDSEIFVFRHNQRVRITEYLICPIVKEHENKHFLLIQ